MHFNKPYTIWVGSKRKRQMTTISDCDSEKSWCEEMKSTFIRARASESVYRGPELICLMRRLTWLPRHCHNCLNPLLLFLIRVCCNYSSLRVEGWGGRPDCTNVTLALQEKISITGHYQASTVLTMRRLSSGRKKTPSNLQVQNSELKKKIDLSLDCHNYTWYTFESKPTVCSSAFNTLYVVIESPLLFKQVHCAMAGHCLVMILFLWA